jgi:hypothetical protein
VPLFGHSYRAVANCRVWRFPDGASLCDADFGHSFDSDRGGTKNVLALAVLDIGTPTNLRTNQSDCESGVHLGIMWAFLNLKISTVRNGLAWCDTKANAKYIYRKSLRIITMLPVKQVESKRRKLRLAVVDLATGAGADQNFVRLNKGTTDKGDEFEVLIKRLIKAFDMVLLCNANNENARQRVVNTITANNDEAVKAQDLDHTGWTISLHHEKVRTISGECILYDMMLHRADKSGATSVWYELRRTPFQRSLLHPEDLIWCPGLRIEGMNRDEDPAKPGDWINRWEGGSNFVRKHLPGSPMTSYRQSHRR